MVTLLYFILPVVFSVAVALLVFGMLSWFYSIDVRHLIKTGNVRRTHERLDVTQKASDPASDIAAAQPSSSAVGLWEQIGMRNSRETSLLEMSTAQLSSPNTTLPWYAADTLLGTALKTHSRHKAKHIQKVPIETETIGRMADDWVNFYRELALARYDVPASSIESALGSLTQYSWEDIPRRKKSANQTSQQVPDISVSGHRIEKAVN